MSDDADPTDLFVRGLWKIIPDEKDASWVLRLAGNAPSHGPLGDYGSIVREMLDKGVSPGTIARFARIVGYETAFGICYHLDDPNASYEGFPEVEERISWGLCRIDPDSGEPLEHLDSGHERLLMAAPDGREMRPPDAEA